MAIIAPDYQVILSYDHRVLGDIRKYAQDLHYVVSSSRYGVDSITFTIDMNIFSDWLNERLLGFSGFSGDGLRYALKPILLDCVIQRNGEDLVGGCLIQMPHITFTNDSATLEMTFDGYMNLLDGVIIAPTPTQSKTPNQFISDWVTTANQVSTAFVGSQGGSHGFLIEYDSTDSIVLPTIQRTYDSYKTMKEAIFEMCDNIEGAGEFDVIFLPQIRYDIIDVLRPGVSGLYSIPKYIIQNDSSISGQMSLFYPAGPNGAGIVAIEIEQADDFASHAFVLGNGDTSSDPSLNTVITSEYPTTISGTYEFPAYREKIWQYSSITRQATLDGRAQSLQGHSSKIRWQPTLTLAGIHIPPSPTADNGIWIRKRIKIETDKDPLNIFARTAIVRELEVSVSSTNGEEVRPLIEFED